MRDYYYQFLQGLDSIANNERLLRRQKLTSEIKFALRSFLRSAHKFPQKRLVNMRIVTRGSEWLCYLRTYRVRRRDTRPPHYRERGNDS